MHADLVKLLDLQHKDTIVDDVRNRMEALNGEFAGLDRILQQAQNLLDGARACGRRGHPAPR